MVVGVVTLLLVACSSSSDDGGGPTVSVTASNSQCLLATNKLPVGTITFEVRNTGDQPTEVDVFGARGKVFAAEKNVGPGATARFTAKLPRGYYQVACKPGQTGNGIREALTVE